MVTINILRRKLRRSINSPTKLVPRFSGNTTLSFDGKPSPDNPPSPSFVPHSGLVAIHLRKSFLLASGIIQKYLRYIYFVTTYTILYYKND